MKIKRAAAFAVIVVLSFGSWLSAQTTPASDYLIPFPAHQDYRQCLFCWDQRVGNFFDYHAAGKHSD